MTNAFLNRFEQVQFLNIFITTHFCCYVMTSGSVLLFNYITTLLLCYYYSYKKSFLTLASQAAHPPTRVDKFRYNICWRRLWRGGQWKYNLEQCRWSSCSLLSRKMLGRRYICLVTSVLWTLFQAIWDNRIPKQISTHAQHNWYCIHVVQ